MSEQDTITVEYRVSYPREALVGRPYVLKIDLRLADSQTGWPDGDEECPVTFILDTMPLFSHVSITSPSVVLHRFDRTYSSASFMLTALQETPHGSVGEIGILMVNRDGLPLKQITLPTSIEKSIAVQPTELSSTRKPNIAHAGDVEFAQLDIFHLKPIRTLTQAFDNQWLPQKLLKKAFEAGTITESVDQELRRSVRAGYIHSLLNSQQVIIHRAHFYNNPIIAQDYIQPTGTNREAFKTLLSEGTIVPYLLTEQAPVDPPASGPQTVGGFETIKVFDAWKTLCQEIRTNCIKLSWDDQENRALARRYLAERFSNLVLTSSIRDIDIYLRNLKLDDSARDPLRLRLIEVERFCQDLLAGGKVPTRNQLYKRFVTAGDNPAERRYDNSKPFAFEIKQLLDLAFNCNLPDALESYLITPYDTLPRTALQEWQPVSTLPTMTGEELMKLLQRMAFSLVGQLWNIPSLDALSLSDVRVVRSMDEWPIYMQSLQDLLRDPLRFAEGGASSVYDSYSKLAQQITNMIARQDRVYNPLTTWSPLVEITFSVSGATLSCVKTESDSIWQLSGHVSDALVDRDVPVAGRLIIRDATQIMRDTTEMGAQEDLGISLDFGRFTMQDITRQWKEIERQVKKLRGYRDTGDLQRVVRHDEANMSYREIVNV